jgi:hypothetical protein
MTREMADYSAIIFHLEQKFPPKIIKTNKSSYHFPNDSSVEDVYGDRVVLGLNVINVHQIVCTHPLPHGGIQLVIPPLFLVNLSRNEKLQDIFNLTSLNHILIKGEAYPYQSGLV